MNTPQIIILCCIVPYFFFATCWPLLAFIMPGIRQARRDRVCKQPTIIRRNLMIIVLPLVLTQCQEADAGIAPTFWQLPQHAAKVASEMPPDRLWSVIILFLMLDLGAHYMLAQITAFAEWEKGYKDGTEDGREVGFENGFEEGTDYGRDQERAESGTILFERGVKLGAQIAEDRQAPRYIIGVGLAKPEGDQQSPEYIVESGTARFKREIEKSFEAAEKELHPEQFDGAPAQA